MDAAAREELDALRRRAFSPTADIHDDPAALARLIELEELALPVAAVEVVEPPVAIATGPAAPTAEPFAVTTAVSVGNSPRPAPAWRRAVIASAAAVAVIVSGMVLAQPSTEPLERSGANTAGVSTKEFVAEAPSVTLMSIHIDASFGGYIELPTDKPTPQFPATTTLAWTVFLGEYYGWELWVAGGEAGDEHCILIRRGDETRGRCSDEEEQGRGALRVSIAGPDIPAYELPAPMEARDRIRFRWFEGGRIDLSLGMFGGD